MLASGGVFPEEIACVCAFLHPSSAVCCAFVHGSCTLREQRNVTEHLETGHCVCSKTDLVWQRLTNSWSLLMLNQNCFRPTFSMISFSIKKTLAEIRTQIWIKFEWLVVLIGYIHTARKCDPNPHIFCSVNSTNYMQSDRFGLVQTISPYLICVHIHLPLCGEFDWHSIWPIIMQNPPFLSDKQAWQETGH